MFFNFLQGGDFYVGTPHVYTQELLDAYDSKRGPVTTHFTKAIKNVTSHSHIVTLSVTPQNAKVSSSDTPVFSPVS